MYMYNNIYISNIIKIYYIYPRVCIFIIYLLWHGASVWCSFSCRTMKSQARCRDAARIGRFLSIQKNLRSSHVKFPGKFPAQETNIWANYSGWWYTYHLEKWWISSMGRMASHMLRKIKTCLKPPTSNGFWCCKAPNMGWFSSIVFCKFWDWPGWSAAGAVMGAKKSGSCGYANIYAAHGLEIGASPHFYLL